MKKQFDNSQITVAYNADKQEIIGIFSSRSVAARYFWGNVEKISNIAYSISKRTHTRNSEFKLAFRNPKPEHIELLKDKVYVLLNGYKEPTTSLSGFHDNRFSLHRYMVDFRPPFTNYKS